MHGDPLGNLQLSPEGIIARDEVVFSEALRRKIPISMVFPNLVNFSSSWSDIVSFLGSLWWLSERDRSRHCQVDH